MNTTTCFRTVLLLSCALLGFALSACGTSTPPPPTAQEPSVGPRPVQPPSPIANPEPGAMPEPGVVPEPGAIPEPDAVPEPNATPEPDLSLDAPIEPEMAPGNPLSAGLAAQIGSAMDQAVAGGIPGVVVYVETPQGVFLEARGMANIEAQVPMTPATRLRIASNSKAFLGVAAAKLHNDGTFDLDTPISNYLSGALIDSIANAPGSTTRQLLTHTSGIYDYLGNEAFWDTTKLDTTRVWTAEETLVFAQNQPASFAIGAGYAYSNSNYLLAGLVLDSVLGHHHAREFEARIFEPLGMGSAWYEHHGTSTGGLAHGYAANESFKDYFAIDAGYGLADGGLAMSASDLATFIRELSDENGRLLTASERTDMFNGHDFGTENYGLGISVFREQGFPTCYGHGGNIIGYQSDMFSWPEEGSTMVVFANATEGSVDQVYSDFVRAVEELVSTAQ